jgi:hypothetical protein
MTPVDGQAGLRDWLLEGAGGGTAGLVELAARCRYGQSP